VSAEIAAQNEQPKSSWRMSKLCGWGNLCVNHPAIGRQLVSNLRIGGSGQKANFVAEQKSTVRALDQASVVAQRMIAHRERILKPR
jgi:hypothetical protein